MPPGPLFPPPPLLLTIQNDLRDVLDILAAIHNTHARIAHILSSDGLVQRVAAIQTTLDAWKYTPSYADAAIQASHAQCCILEPQQDDAQTPTENPSLIPSIGDDVPNGDCDIHPVYASLIPLASASTPTPTPMAPQKDMPTQQSPHAATTPISRFATPLDPADAPADDDEATWRSLVAGPISEGGYESGDEGGAPRERDNDGEDDERDAMTPCAVDPPALSHPKPMPTIHVSTATPRQVDCRCTGTLSPLSPVSATSSGSGGMGASTTSLPRATASRNTTVNARAETTVTADREAPSGLSAFASARRIVGGPSASVEELAVLARRVPLRIRVRVPEEMRSHKRKRDDVAGAAGDRVAVAPDAARKRTKPAPSKRGSKEICQYASPASTSTPEVFPPMPSASAHAFSKTTTNDAIMRDGSQWPALPAVFVQWDNQFIQCDSCDAWYHYGCVGITSGDLRLDPSAVYICPTCHLPSTLRRTLRRPHDACARPDCPRPQTQSASDPAHFLVEKLVGRKKIGKHVYLWLAKWEGYPITQATWIPRENVDGDGTTLFNGFIEAALDEGIDLARNVVLLREAVDAGWGSEDQNTVRG